MQGRAFYLLATAKSFDKVEKLAKGQRVLVAGKRKSIDELKVEDALKLRKVPRKKLTDPTDTEIDKKRAATAQIPLGDLCQQIEDWANDLSRFQKTGLEIRDRHLVIATLRETRTAINNCLSVLK